MPRVSPLLPVLALLSSCSVCSFAAGADIACVDDDACPETAPYCVAARCAIAPDDDRGAGEGEGEEGEGESKSVGGEGEGEGEVGEGEGEGEGERCSENDDCDDGLFCTGVDLCDVVSGRCSVPEAPCSATGQVCDEPSRSCRDCSRDADCDDGRFCNGDERCGSGGCEDAGVDDVCFASGLVCDEALDVCAGCGSDADCDVDGDPCNGGARCTAAGVCERLPPPQCPGETFCRPADGRCVACLDDAQCDQGLACEDGVCG